MNVWQLKFGIIIEGKLLLSVVSASDGAVKPLNEWLRVKRPVRCVLKLPSIELCDRQHQPLTHKRITAARQARNLSLLYPFNGLFALLSSSVMN